MLQRHDDDLLRLLRRLQVVLDNAIARSDMLHDHQDLARSEAHSKGQRSICTVKSRGKPYNNVSCDQPVYQVFLAHSIPRGDVATRLECASMSSSGGRLHSCSIAAT